MKIMVIEDNTKKRRAIEGHLKAGGISDDDILRVRNMSDFAGSLSNDIGLFIIDFNLPNHDGGDACQNGQAILESIIKAGKQDALLLAISSYPNDFPQLRERYEAQGCILADFANKSWKSTLDHILIQLKKNTKFDFVVFCALQEERNPYVALLQGKQVNRGGLDCFDVEISGRKGTIVLHPNMGLVNAAVTAGVCIDRFKPSLVGMSGICGGFQGRAKLGQLLISSMAYEYQTGKWAGDGFRQEPYQVATDNSTITAMKILAGTANLLTDLEADFKGTRPAENNTPDAAIFTSGSAVIADDKFLKQIETFHRKVGALDMEIFAIQRAAELSPGKPACICAKAVVDLCSSEKNDDLHSYGSYISAKFMIKAIDTFFNEVHEGGRRRA